MCDGYRALLNGLELGGVDYGGAAIAQGVGAGSGGLGEGPGDSLVLRQSANPRPYCPPTTKAAFFIPGTTTRQRARVRRPRGMLLSGVAMISRSVSVALRSLLSGVSSWAGSIAADTASGAQQY